MLYEILFSEPKPSLYHIYYKFRRNGKDYEIKFDLDTYCYLSTFGMSYSARVF